VEEALGRCLAGGRRRAKRRLQLRFFNWMTGEATAIGLSFMALELERGG
jgi:hypothetical protein